MPQGYKLVSDDSGRHRLKVVIHPANEQEHGNFPDLDTAQDEAQRTFAIAPENWKLVPELLDHYYAFDEDGVRVELQPILGYVHTIAIG